VARTAFASSVPPRAANRRGRAGRFRAQRGIQKGQRLRAGIEGCISVLFSCRGMKRCRPKAANVSRHWWAAAMLANNLLRIADLLRTASRHDNLFAFNGFATETSWPTNKVLPRLAQCAEDWC